MKMLAKVYHARTRLLTELLKADEEAYFALSLASGNMMDPSEINKREFVYLRAAFALVEGLRLGTQEDRDIVNEWIMDHL